MTARFTVPEADHDRLRFSAPRAIEILQLDAGPRALPTWAAGAAIDWHWPYDNRPSYKIRCKVDPLAFAHDGSPVWRRFTDGKHVGWMAEREGVASCHYHDGMISMQEFTDHVTDGQGRCVWIEEPDWKVGKPGVPQTRTYSMLATTKQEGYGGRAFDIVLDEQEVPIWIDGKRELTRVEAGTKLRLRGPWHGGAPTGFTEVSYQYDKPGDYHRAGTPWERKLAYFGLLIRPAILIDVMATFLPHVQWAVCEFEKCLDLEPLIPATGLPKAWHVHPDDCSGHDFTLSPWATGRDRTHPNDRCKYCGVQRRPGWVYVSSLTGKAMAQPVQPEPLYFDPFLTPRPPRPVAFTPCWPTDVRVPARSMKGLNV